MDDEETQYYRIGCSRIIHDLDNISQTSHTGYCLVLISPNKSADIHCSPEMRPFVQTFLQRHEVNSFVSKNELLPSMEVRRPSPDPQHTIDLAKPAEVEYYLEECLISLQQQACKTIAKAWVRAIEPRKQTNYPYKRGDGCKPEWWPKSIRHKEPDHLMKPERIRLLVSLVRCKSVTVSRLRRATDECMSLLQGCRLSILEEVYYIAHMERQYSLGKIQNPRVAVSFMSDRVKQGIQVRANWPYPQKPQGQGPQPIPRPRPRPPINHSGILTPPSSSSSSAAPTQAATPEALEPASPATPQRPQRVNTPSNTSAPSTPSPDKNEESEDVIALKQEPDSPAPVPPTQMPARKGYLTEVSSADTASAQGSPVQDSPAQVPTQASPIQCSPTQVGVSPTPESSVDTESDNSSAFLTTNPMSSMVMLPNNYHDAACGFGSPFYPQSNPYSNFFYNPTAGWPSDPLLQYSNYYVTHPLPSSAASGSFSSPVPKHSQVTYTPVLTPTSHRRQEEGTPTKTLAQY